MNLENALQTLHQQLASGEAQALDCPFAILRPHTPRDRYPANDVRYALREVHPLQPNDPSMPSENPAVLASRLHALLPRARSDEARLTLLERFGGFVAHDGGVAFFDHARIECALAACGNETLMVRADLSGIQSFIYDVEDEGALRNLRARSFYLELLAQHAITRVLEDAGVSRAHVTYVGGGGFQLLLPARAERVLTAFRDAFDDWLWHEHGGTLGFLLVWARVPTADLLDGSRTAAHQRELSARLAHAKAQRRHGKLARVFAERADPFELAARRARGEDALRHFGQQLPKAAYLEVSTAAPAGGSWVQVHDRWYRPTRERPDGPRFALNSLDDLDATPMLTGNHVTRLGDVPPHLRLDTGEAHDPARVATHEELAALALGQPRLALYRCDADNMGSFFAGGIPGHNLKRHATLSRLMALFFQGYANAIAARATPLLPSVPQADRERHGRYINFVYSGGDDAVVVGPWNEVLAFAVDFRRAYRRFTGGNPHLGLSGGSFIAKAKYPLRRMAEHAEHAEQLAKQVGRDDTNVERRKDGFVPFLMSEAPGQERRLARRWDVFMNLERNDEDTLERTLGVLQVILRLARRADPGGIELATSRQFLWKLRDFVEREGDVWRVPLLHYAIARADVPDEHAPAWSDAKTLLLNPDTWPHLDAVLAFLHLARPPAEERERSAE